MSDVGANNGIEGGYGQARASISGPLGIIGLIALVSIASLIYVTWSGTESLRAEVVATRQVIAESNKGHDLMACVITLSAEQRHNIQTATSKEDFTRWCPWLLSR